MSRFQAFDVETEDGEPFEFAVGEYRFRCVSKLSFNAERYLADISKPGFELQAMNKLLFIKMCLDGDDYPRKLDENGKETDEVIYPEDRVVEYGQPGWVPANYDDLVTILNRKKNSISVATLDRIFETIVEEMTGHPFLSRGGKRGGASKTGPMSLVNGQRRVMAES